MHWEWAESSGPDSLSSYSTGSIRRRRNFKNNARVVDSAAQGRSENPSMVENYSRIWALAGSAENSSAQP
jgi:hypothetical protein